MTGQQDGTRTSGQEGRVLLALLLPIVGAVLMQQLLGTMVGGAGETAVPPLFAGLGIVSWALGMRWYGVRGMGLRGGRPLFAGIGFATLGWIIFLICRIIFVRFIGYDSAATSFFFSLIFEGFALHLWVFGLLFRVVAAWRGGLTAAISSGVVFGAAAFLFFQEAFVGGLNSLLYFVVWGILYGIIRLRTGSFLGIIIVQALHSYTSWVVMAPAPQPALDQLQRLYLAAAVLYAVVIWRLWPKTAADYRL